MLVPQNQNNLAKSYAELAAGIYRDTSENRYVLVAGPDNISFIQMDKTSDAEVLKTCILEMKGDLKGFLAPNAEPYTPPTAEARRQQLDRDILNLEMFLGKGATQHIADDHPDGSSARARLLGLR